MTKTPTPWLLFWLAANMISDNCVYEFAHFKLDPAEHLLLSNGVPVSLTGKAFQVLLVLVKNGGHLVEKSEIVTAVWGDTFVEEGNIAVTVSMLRKRLEIIGPASSI